MTVSTTSNTVVYRGNGAATSFAVPFKVLDEDHLIVVRRVYATGVDEHTYVGTDYSYSGLGDSSGTLTLEGAALTDDYQLIIQRIVPYTQDLDIVNAGGFYPESVEEQLDQIVMGIQQIASDVGRALRVSAGNTIDAINEDMAGMYLAFDANGDPIGASGTGADSALRTDLAETDGASLVGFSILSAEARERSLLDRVREHPSVFDFEGIHADEINDDFTAIRNAVEWSGSNKKRLLVPTANYLISDTLVFETVGWEFIGEGLASSRIYCTTAAPAVLVSGFAGEMSGIDFRGEGVSETGIVLLSASTSRFKNVDCINFTLDGVLFDSAWDGGALTGRQNNTVIIDGGQFSLNDRSGIRMEQQPDNNGCVFRDFLVNGNGSHGIMMKGEGNEIRGGNIFANVGYGVQWGEAADTSFNVSNVIAGCWIESNVAGGVRGGGRSLRNWWYRKNLSQSYTAAVGSIDMEVTLGGGGLITYNNGTSTIALDTEGNIILINGTQVIGPRETGWAAMTGTATKTAIATYTAPAISGAYTQAEVQALADAVQANSRRLKAIGDALATHGLIGA